MQAGAELRELSSTRGALASSRRWRTGVALVLVPLLAAAQEVGGPCSGPCSGPGGHGAASVSFDPWPVEPQVFAPNPVAASGEPREYESDGLDRGYRPRLFDGVAGILRRQFFDAEFRRGPLAELERRYRDLAESAESLGEERGIVQRFLSQIPISHLALYSRPTHDRLMAELACRSGATFGFQLTRLGDDFFVDKVLEGGPASDSGLARGDRVLEIDGVPPSASPRLDWRSDDAALPDPPLHGMLCEIGEEVELLVERRSGERSRGSVVARSYSACEASAASAEVIDVEGTDGTEIHRIGYVHLWFVASPATGDLVSELVSGSFADCDGLLLDLRGRGGNGNEVARLTGLLSRLWARPVILLTDRGTRSAKELIAHRMQSSGAALVVGERTAGAVIPASFRRIGSEAVLMFPRTTLGQFTDILEGSGVEPDIEISDRLAYAAGSDPIREAGVLAMGVWLDEE